MEALLTETRGNWPPANTSVGRPPKKSSWLQHLTRNPRSRVWRPFFHLFDFASSVTLGFVYFLLRRVPQRYPLLLARPLAWIIRAPIKRPIMRRLRRIFADRDWAPSQFNKLWSEFLDHVGLSLVEPLWLELMNDEELKEHITVVGEEHLRAALAHGCGAMLFINHVGESGVVPTLGRRGYDLTFVTDPMPVPFFERRLNGYCATMNTRRLMIGGRTAFEIAHAFARNGIVAAYTDISLTPRRGQWVPFGPAELRLHPGPAIIALRHRVPVLYANAERLPGNRHRITIKPLQYDPTHDFFEDVRTLLHQAASHLYAEVRRRPAQWWALDFVDVRARRSRSKSSPPSAQPVPAADTTHPVQAVR